MKITVIGYQSPFPGLNQATPGYLLEDHHGCKVLLDCGSGIASSLHQWTAITSLDAIVLSHYHHDHVADLGVIQYACLLDLLEGNRNQPLPVYGPMEPVETYLSKRDERNGCNRWSSYDHWLLHIYLLSNWS